MTKIKFNLIFIPIALPMDDPDALTYNPMGMMAELADDSYAYKGTLKFPHKGEYIVMEKQITMEWDRHCEDWREV